MKRDGLENCAQVMVAVRAPSEDVQSPIDFGERRKRESGAEHGKRATRLFKNRAPPSSGVRCELLREVSARRKLA